MIRGPVPRFPKGESGKPPRGGVEELRRLRRRERRRRARGDDVASDQRTAAAGLGAGRDSTRRGRTPGLPPLAERQLHVSGGAGAPTVALATLLRDQPLSTRKTSFALERGRLTGRPSAPAPGCSARPRSARRTPPADRARTATPPTASA